MLLVCATLCFVIPGSGCSSLPAKPAATGDRAALLKEQFGIEVASLRMSGNGHLIDFRYRVFDPDKAAMMADKKYAPCMIDQATGVRLKIPNTPKLGPLRQSAARLEAGKIYFMLFANSGTAVKAGSKVTIVIGDFKLEDMTVE